MKIPYIKHNHSICLLAYHFVTVTKRRKPELEGIDLELFKQAVEKYPITIHVGEVMLTIFIYSYKPLLPSPLLTLPS